MRKLLLATLLMSALTAGAQGFITHRAKVAKQQSEAMAKKAATRSVALKASQQRGYFFVNCAADADAQQVARELQTAGAAVRMVRGDLILLDAPYSKLETLASVKGVQKIDISPKVSMKTDASRKATQADLVNDGTGDKLPQAYTGKGVIVGIIDGGFDFTHPMFKDKDGNLRIKGVYEPGNYEFGGDSVRIGEWTLTGSAYSKTEDILDTLKVKDTNGSHGTHCISIAAGSISDVKGLTKQPLGGIAPEADILICPVTATEGFLADMRDQQIDANAYLVGQSLEYMTDQAIKMKKPLVVSFSMNSHDGWHDGTSNMARMLGSYVKDLRLPLMLCASNEGGNMIYLNLKSAAKDTISILATPGQEYSYAWGGMKTTKNVKMQIAIVSMIDGYKYYQMPLTFNSDPDEGKYGQGTYFYAGEDADNSHLEGPELKAVQEMLKYIENGSPQIWCYQNQAKDKDDKLYTYNEVLIDMAELEFKPQINDRGKEKRDDVLGFKLNLIPEEATELHCWADAGAQLIGQDNDGKYLNGDGSVSIGDWNTSGEPVSIGAYAANNLVKTIDDKEPTELESFPVGDVAWFSSYGTDLAGHKHPDVCSPGVVVVAAGNSFDPEIDIDPLYEKKGYANQFTGQKGDRDYSYISMSGTSMATPAAAGVVALWLQAAMDKGKTLTSADIKDIIKHSADKDEFTEKSPERFGEGKINAYKGILYVLGIDTSIPTLSKEQPKDVNFRVSGDIVYTDGAEEGTEATIYNLQGVPVKQTTVQGGAISLEGLQQGVYAIQLGKLGSTLIRK